jgi:hypothetical protein
MLLALINLSLETHSKYLLLPTILCKPYNHPNLLSKEKWFTRYKFLQFPKNNGFFFSFLFLTVRGVELRASDLLSRHSATWATPKALFALGIFYVVSCIYVQAGLDCNPPIYTSCLAGMRGMGHYT